MEIVFVSAGLDPAMYARCISENQHARRHRLVFFDNRIRDDGLPVLYNRFLREFDYSRPAWIIFCHEDFQPLEDIEDCFEGLPTNSIYGPIGSRMNCAKSLRTPGGIWSCENLGRIIQSRKDGSDIRMVGNPVEMGEEVDSLDCMCIAVHSSLVKEHNLQFDNRLDFDLYVEDFCASGFANHGIATRILPFQCRHWSAGRRIEAPFLEKLRYLDRKYPSWEFASTTGYSFGLGRTFWRRMQRKIIGAVNGVSPGAAQKIKHIFS